MIQRPNAVVYDRDRDISTLYFPGGFHADYRLRGGVCWPREMIDEHGQADVEGFILLTGEEASTGLIWIFEQTPFKTVTHIVDHSTGSIKYAGIATWLLECWSRYHGIKFFFHQDYELSKRYRLDVIRDTLIIPKPQFIEVPWADDDQARIIVWEQISLQRLRFDKDSAIDNALRKLQRMEKELPPAVHALMCCLTGIKRFPYRKEEQRRIAA